jgi:hypothetical protein
MCNNFEINLPVFTQEENEENLSNRSNKKEIN